MTVPRCLAQARAQRNAATERGRQRCLDQARVTEQVSHQLERLAERACAVMGAPVANISLLDADHQRALATHGAPKSDIAREMSVCAHMIPTGEGLVVSDMTRSPLLSDHPYVDDLHLRSYCGLPLRSTRGSVVGAMCVIDTKKRTFTDEQLTAFQQLADKAQRLIMSASAADEAPVYGPSAGALRDDPLMQWIDEHAPTVEQLRERRKAPRRLFARRAA